MSGCNTNYSSVEHYTLANVDTGDTDASPAEENDETANVSGLKGAGETGTAGAVVVAVNVTHYVIGKWAWDPLTIPDKASQGILLKACQIPVLLINLSTWLWPVKAGNSPT